MSLMIKGGLIVTSSGSYTADLYVENEKIKAIGNNLNHQADEVINAQGKYVLPGAIDPHTHLAMPYLDFCTQDDYETGTIAAACGGVTCVVDFATQQKGESLFDTIERKKSWANGKAVVDYSLHPAITDPRKEIIDEIKKAIWDYGTPSFKIYMVYDIRVDDGVIIKLLEEARKQDGLVQVHAENRHMIDYMNEVLAAQGKLSPRYHAVSRPNIAEEEAVSRVAKMVELTGSRIYIVHLSTKEGLACVKEAQQKGLEIYTETCPQYLVLSEKRYQEPDFEGAKYVISPPLRTEDSQTALWSGINGNHIQVIATDHCPFDFKGKKDLFGQGDYKKIPNGAPGIETMLMLIHSEGVHKGRISLEKMVDVLSTRTAKMFGLKEKGELLPDKDADIVIFDPLQTFTITQSKLHMNVDYTPFEGMEVTGMPLMIFSRGKKIAQWNGEKVTFIGEIGRGQFIKREPFRPL